MMDRIKSARLQRQTANSYEQLLWHLLRNRRRCQMKFRRQHPIGTYTADFYCAEARLVVDVDGAHHLTKKGRRHDAIRDRWIMEQGILVLRFRGKRIELETLEVCNEIDAILRERLSK
jgi:very-short-patch-repair endonuclease